MSRRGFSPLPVQSTGHEACHSKHLGLPLVFDCHQPVEVGCGTSRHRIAMIRWQNGGAQVSEETADQPGL